MFGIVSKKYEKYKSQNLYICINVYRCLNKRPTDKMIIGQIPIGKKNHHKKFQLYILMSSQEIHVSPFTVYNRKSDRKAFLIIKYVAKKKFFHSLYFSLIALVTLLSLYSSIRNYLCSQLMKQEIIRKVFFFNLWQLTYTYKLKIISKPAKAKYYIIGHI